MNSFYTIGHSTRPIEEFVAILKKYDVTQLVDIRSIPGSKHNPQYGQDSLKMRLLNVGIYYNHMKHLGGLRPAFLNQTINGGWPNKSFQNHVL